jgi:hypothetical protein
MSAKDSKWWYVYTKYNNKIRKVRVVRETEKSVYVSVRGELIMKRKNSDYDMWFKKFSDAKAHAIKVNILKYAKAKTELSIARDELLHARSFKIGDVEEDVE